MNIFTSNPDCHALRIDIAMNEAVALRTVETDCGGWLPWLLRPRLLRPRLPRVAGMPVKLGVWTSTTMRANRAAALLLTHQCLSKSEGEKF